jgi:uncharacterized glyoxalase superfamily protein PhnB
MAEELNDRGLAAIEAALAGLPSARFRIRLRSNLERSIVMSIGQVAPAHARGARPGFTAVTPYIIVPDVEPLIAFAKQVFGAEETHRSIGGAGERPLAPRLMGLHIYVDDADDVYRRAIEAGAESLGAPADRPYGERAGFVRDSAGNHWYIATHLGPSYFAGGATTVTPHVYVQRRPGRGASEFIDFMTAALNARVEARHQSPEGFVGHAVVRIEGAAIELGEGTGPGLSAPAGFYLYVEDCDALYRQALEHGATSRYGPADMPFGDRMAGVEDPWGNEWFIATHFGREGA